MVSRAAARIGPGAIVMLGLLGGCASPVPPSAPAPTPPPARVALKVANLPYIAFAPFYIGIEEGFFKDQNIDVELVNFATQPDTVGALVSGQVDVIAGQTSAGMNNLIARGADARLVADKGYIDPNACDNIALMGSRTLASEGRAVTADMLRGKNINVVTGTWNEYLVDKLLAPVGLKLSDFNNIDVPIPLQPQALDTGQLSAVMENEPWVTRMAATGNKPILSQAHEVVPDSQSAVTMFGSKLIGANAEVGNRFMVAYLQAVHRYNEGKTDRNLTILAQYTQLDKPLLQQMCWPALRNDGSINVDSMLDFQTWAMNKGLQPTALTREQLWDPSFTQVANQRLASK